jgi:aspartyl-tRNA(Asn)/glutamyl-tRNA(Gln) amidotransferase subunit C
MAIDKPTVQHVADLACLSLTDEETTKMAADLGSILQYVEELNELDTTNVPPTSHVLMGRTAWREDEAKPGISHDDALSQAPRTAEGGFAVPTFVES